MSSKTVILADGSFPSHEIPLGYLRNAGRIICCDGSAEALVNAGLVPDAIVGDLDSLKKAIAKRFSDRLFRDKGQETNDLTKAVKWCAERGYGEIVIVGATGKREDHTIGNISLLAEYVKDMEVIMVTDTGILLPFTTGCKVSSFPGQQVSVFSVDTETEITSKGLKYPLTKRKLKNWWTATLNEAVGTSFTLEFTGGPVIVYLEFPGPDS
jgi:thiamine pyrophosphokinase